MNKYDIEGVKKYLSLKGSLEIESHGTSMFPAIKDGDKIIVSVMDDSIEINDIIVFFDSSNSGNISLIAHRVIRVVDNKFVITKGDNNRAADRPISRKCIIGKVISVVSEEGKCWDEKNFT